MKSIFATPEDLVRNLARMNTVDTGGDDELVALNRMIEEARALCEARPEATKPPEVKWNVEVQAVANLRVSMRVSASSEEEARGVALTRAEALPIECFEHDGPEGINVFEIERFP